MMFHIKVCGITEPRGLQAVVEAGADAVGFNFYPASPRFVVAEKAAELIQSLPGHVATVGVFVNRPLEEALSWMERSGVEWAQFHGDERPDELRDFPRPWYPALRPAPGQLPDLTAWKSPWVLVDACVQGVYGGTGKRADWNVAASLACQGPILLAGGLGPDNLSEALDQVKPEGVDLNSGVESAPGIKDPELLARAMEVLLPWRACLEDAREL